MKKLLLSLFLFSLMIAGAMTVTGEDVLSSYTYIPGEKVLVYEDLSTTPVGDIPTGGLIVNGETETVLIGGEKWLKLGSGAQLSFEITPNTTDLTLEFLLRGRGDTGFRMILEKPEKEYESFIDAGNLGGHWEGGYKGKELPSSSTSKEFYGDDQTIQFAITLQKDRVKFYINKILMMNAANFTPVMPTRITLGFSETEFCAVKDFRLATLAPDIAKEILNKGKYVSHGVYFDTGSAKVRQESHYVLRRIADVSEGEHYLEAPNHRPYR